jgi:ATP-dependent RNA helicase DeaD
MTFKEMLLQESIQKLLQELNLLEPTPIQEKTIPFLLEQNPVDLHAQAQTGTGKTLAFGIPLLHRIDPNSDATQAVVIAPTRELAIQIFDSLKPFLKCLNLRGALVYGGVSMSEQLNQLRAGAHLVVGTPGRINDYLIKKTLNFSNLKTLVLDEADVLFDMGFKDEIEELLSRTSPTRELWLFSATIKPTIQEFKMKYMNNPKEIAAPKIAQTQTTIKQYFAIAPFSHRIKALIRFIDKTNNDFYGFIFCQTKLLTADVADQLAAKGYRAQALHGDMSQDQRNLVIKKIRSKELNILVATDVAARGLDIPDLTHVINFSLPEDNETYIHRIGRTGRAGKEGVSISFINPSEQRKIDYLAKRFGIQIQKIDIPTKEEVVEIRFKRLQEYVEEKSAIQLEEAVKNQLYVQIKEKIAVLDSSILQELVTYLIKQKFFNDIEEQDLFDKTIQDSYKSDRRSEGGSGRREGGFRGGRREGGFRSGGSREGGFRSGGSREGGFRSGGSREGGFRSEGGFRGPRSESGERRPFSGDRTDRPDRGPRDFDKGNRENSFEKPSFDKGPRERREGAELDQKHFVSDRYNRKHDSFSKDSGKREGGFRRDNDFKRDRQSNDGDGKSSFFRKKRDY